MWKKQLRRQWMQLRSNDAWRPPRNRDEGRDSTAVASTRDGLTGEYQCGKEYGLSRKQGESPRPHPLHLERRGLESDRGNRDDEAAAGDLVQRDTDRLRDET